LLPQELLLYRDTEGTGEWRILPWDADLSFVTCGRMKRHRICAPPLQPPTVLLLRSRIYYTNCYSRTSLGIGGGNHFVDALFGNPAIYQMYLRRCGPSPTRTSNHRIRTLLVEIRKHGEPTRGESHRRGLGFTKWVVPAQAPVFGPTQSLAQAVYDLNVVYFPPRRQWIYGTLASTAADRPLLDGPPLHSAQPTNVVIKFGAMEVNPASGNQAQEYVQFVNTNRFPWTSRLEDHRSHRTYLPARTVIPSNSVIYVSPTRCVRRGPPRRAWHGLFVQGNYKGQLSPVARCSNC